jgi:hypothetical protein
VQVVCKILVLHMAGVVSWVQAGSSKQALLLHASMLVRAAHALQPP